MNKSRVLAAAAVGAAALAGCTSSPGVTIGPAFSPPVSSSLSPAASTPSRSSAASTPVALPARSPASSGPPALSPDRSPASSAPPARPVDLSPRSVPNCAGCRVVAVHRDLHPGVSVALLVGPVNEFAEKAVVVAYRSRTGAVLGQAVVPDGERFTGQDMHPPLLPCDNLAHCFVLGNVGAHGGTAAVLAISRAGSVRVIGHYLAANPSFTLPDLDGDGVREIVSIQGDITAPRFWQVRHWAPSAGVYVVVNCAPYRDGSRPPTNADPASCPA